jgi:hypothetical protein
MDLPPKDLFDCSIRRKVAFSEYFELGNVRVTSKGNFALKCSTFSFADDSFPSSKESKDQHPEIENAKQIKTKSFSSDSVDSKLQGGVSSISTPFSDTRR